MQQKLPNAMKSHAQHMWSINVLSGFWFTAAFFFVFLPRSVPHQPGGWSTRTTPGRQQLRFCIHHHAECFSASGRPGAGWFWIPIRKILTFVEQRSIWSICVFGVGVWTLQNRLRSKQDIIKGSLDAKVPSYEALKMRENRCLENRCLENRCLENLRE